MTPAGTVYLWAAVGLLASVAMITVSRNRTDSMPLWQVLAQLIATPTVFALLAWRHDLSAVTYVASGLAVGGVALAVADARARRLPGWLIATACGIVAGVAAVLAVTDRSSAPAGRALLGVLVLMPFCAVLFAVFPGQYSVGHVALSGPMGFALGWHSWAALLIGLLFVWLLTAVWPVDAEEPRAQVRTPPLAPPLVGAALLAMLL